MSTKNRQAIDSPQVWDGRSMAGRSDWVFEVTDEIRGELLSATRLALKNATGWAQINRANFRVPVTANFLKEIAEFLETGPGIAKIRGIDLAHLTETERRIMFYGIGQHLGTPVSMSREGMMMSDVTDEGVLSAERYGHVKDENNEAFLSSRARVHSTGQLRFHNDRCDVVAFETPQGTGRNPVVK